MWPVTAPAHGELLMALAVVTAEATQHQTPKITTGGQKSVVFHPSRIGGQVSQLPCEQLLCPNRSYLLEVLVAVDVLLVVGVLQLVGFDVLPEGLDDGRARLRVYPQQTGQPRVQFELRRLEQKEEEMEMAMERKADTQV